MLNFESDYIQGCAPEILENLTKTNFEALSGYGDDKYTKSAEEKIRKACKCKNAEIYFTTGGTQTNQLVIDSMLNPFEGVISASTGHISVHEAGAVEFTGHKVLTISSYNGKIKAVELKKYIEDFYNDGNHEHMVFPGMVYITFPTEYGTLYSKAELKEISEICRKYKIPLYIDGARLGYGLQSSDCDLTLADIAELCDVFYIGGTKVGALCGEAIVFTNKNMPLHFVNIAKKHGALMAKGRLIGIQFDTLFTDDLYMRLSKNAIDRACELREGFKEAGYQFFIDSPTNQIFIILENQKMKELGEKIRFNFWEKYDDNHTVVRFATSWATTKEEVQELLELL